MKHLFIINPKAGKGTALSYIPLIHSLFEGNSDEYIIEETTGEGSATEIVKRYVSKEVYRVYSIGGDGTLNEVLNGVVGTDSSLGIIPGGTGNDFIRSITNEVFGENILWKTINGKEKYIDLAAANGRFFINIASVGIDAEIVENAKIFKNKSFIKGQLAYVLGLFVTLHKYRFNRINVNIDGMNFSEETLLLSIANGKYYGGGMKVAPNAIINDGLLDICHIRKIKKTRIPFLFPKLIKGTHESIEEVKTYRGKRILINSEKVLTLNLDGEILRGRDVEFKILPSAIKFIIPKD